MAYAFAANDFALCRDGSAVSTDAAGTMPTATRFEIGSSDGSDQLFGHIESVLYWNQRLTNLLLQQITG